MSLHYKSITLCVFFAQGELILYLVFDYFHTMKPNITFTPLRSWHSFKNSHFGH